jgi:hypothetical protein
VNSAELVRWLQTKPFGAFRIVMTDGSCLDIFHPDQVIPSKGTAKVGRRVSLSSINERDITISLLHVIRIEPIDPP